MPENTFRDGTPITPETVAALEAEGLTREGASKVIPPAANRSFGDPEPKLSGVSKEALEAELAKRG